MERPTDITPEIIDQWRWEAEQRIIVEMRGNTPVVCIHGIEVARFLTFAALCTADDAHNAALAYAQDLVESYVNLAQFGKSHPCPVAGCCANRSSCDDTGICHNDHAQEAVSG